MITCTTQTDFCLPSLQNSPAVIPLPYSDGTSVHSFFIENLKSWIWTDVALDVAEDNKVATFISNTCGCSSLKGQPCSTAFTADSIRVTRAQCQGLDHASLDFVLMGQIMANTTNSAQSLVSGPTRTSRQKPYTKFYHQRIKVSNRMQWNKANLTCLLQVCLNTFLFLHGIGKWRYDAVRTYCMNNGIEERIHGNTNHLAHNGFSTDELRNIVTFLQNYAEENTILLPGNIPGYKRTDLQLLPTHTTKHQVWEFYIQCCGKLTFRLAHYRHFCFLWRKYVPHIIITTPRTLFSRILCDRGTWNFFVYYSL